MEQLTSCFANMCIYCLPKMLTWKFNLISYDGYYRYVGKRVLSQSQICHITHTRMLKLFHVYFTGSIRPYYTNFSVTLLRIASIWRSNRLYRRNHNRYRNVMDEMRRNAWLLLLFAHSLTLSFELVGMMQYSYERVRNG